MSTVTADNDFAQMLDTEDALSTTGRWTQEEHELFLRGLKLYNRQWKQIADIIKTRTVVQIRTHAQKYFQKLNKCNKVTCINVGNDYQRGFNQIVKMKTIPNVKSIKEKGKESIDRISTAASLSPKLESFERPLSTPNYIAVSNVSSVDELISPEFLALKAGNDESEFEWLASCLDPMYANTNISNIPISKFENAVSDGSNNIAYQQVTRVHEDFAPTNVIDGFVDFTWLDDRDVANSNYLGKKCSDNNSIPPIGNLFYSGSHVSSSCETSEESSSNSSEEDSSPFDNETVLLDNSLYIGRFSDDIFDKFNENRKKSISCAVFDESSVPKKRGRSTKSESSSSMNEGHFEDINYEHTNNNSHSSHFGQIEMSKNSYSVGDMTSPGYGNSEDEFSTFFGLDL